MMKGFWKIPQPHIAPFLSHQQDSMPHRVPDTPENHVLKKANNRSEPKLPMKNHDDRIETHHPCTKLSRAQRAVPSSACSPSMESAGTFEKSHAFFSRPMLDSPWMEPRMFQGCFTSPKAIRVPNSQEARILFAFSECSAKFLPAHTCVWGSKTQKQTVTLFLKYFDLKFLAIFLEDIENSTHKQLTKSNPSPRVQCSRPFRSSRCQVYCPKEWAGTLQTISVRYQKWIKMMLWKMSLLSNMAILGS